MKFAWQKKGLIFDPTHRFDWMQAYSQVPTVLDRGDFLRVYFTTRPNPDSDGKFISHIAFIDVDKTNPAQIRYVHPHPIMALGKAGTFDEFGIHPTSIITDGGNTLLYYTGWSRGVTVPYETFIGLAVSTDQGDSFERFSDGAVIGKDYRNPYLANGAVVFRMTDRFGMLFASARAWVQSDGRYEPVYHLKTAFSKNGIDWDIPTEPTFPADDDECISRPAVFYFNGSYHVWYGYRKIGKFRQGGMNAYRIGYARSTDLNHWERDDAAAGISLSETGWDSQMMSYPQIVQVGDSLLMFYNGNDFGKAGFGYAELPLSGLTP